jgi:23S rRNA (uracil-5-)-methyltransferase RumA
VSSNQQVKIKKHQTFPLTIKRLGINGEGVGYFKRQVVFVPGALPGEEVVVEATNVHPNFTEGRIKKIRKKSPFRVKPPCSVYEICGGCQLQHLSYERQLVEKRDILIQALERHTQFDITQIEIRPTIGMEDPWHYRNKSQFQLGKQKERVISGLYQLNSHKLVDISTCIVQHPETDKATQIIREILSDLHIPIFDGHTKTPAVRTIVTRIGTKTGQIQVVLITTHKELPKKQLIVDEIKKRLPNVVSIMQNVNPKKTSLIFGEKTYLLYGEPSITEQLEEFSYELSARAFFQLNPEQTIKLYNEVNKAASLTGEEKVLDAYCGVGTIGLWLGKDAKEVRGMDVIPEAIEDARKNAEKHGMSHFVYETGTAEEWLPKWKKQGWIPDVVVVDPPRSGCDREFLKTIMNIKPKRIVYVSCNPSTLAKDLQTLSPLYKIHHIQPVDMFPMTAHVESVTQLELKL